MAQEYIKHVESMRDRYPNLVRFCDAMESMSANSTTHQSRVAVIEIQEKDIIQKTFDSPAELDQYMQGQVPEFRACKHRLYLLEGLQPSYVGVLGSRLRMSPFVFAEQLLRGGTRKEQAAMLPSQHGPEKFSTMQYVEARVFPEAQLNNLGACCPYQDRKVWATKINSRLDDVGQVHRIASHWSRQEEDGTFNSLILLDPPVGESLKIGKGSRKEIRPCHSDLYRGGYIDISPFPCNAELDTLPGPQSGPSRDSMFDDLLFYWSCVGRFPSLHPHILKGALASVDGTSFFLRRIVASNWMQFIVYFDEIIDRLEYALARADIKALDGVENHLSDVEFWHRRCRKSCEQVELTLHTLPNTPEFKQGTSLVNIQPFSGIATYECADDFLYIYNQIGALRERCQRLNVSLTYVVSIIQYKRSSEEAQSLKILTVLGILFVPLSYVSGLFSMSDEFRPGAENFWVYFVTSLPLVGLVFSVVFANQIGEALKIKKRETKALLKVRLSARPATIEQESRDVEKGKS